MLLSKSVEIRQSKTASRPTIRRSRIYIFTQPRSKAEIQTKTLHVTPLKPKRRHITRIIQAGSEHLKPLSPPNISFFGLCHSSREETMALAMEMPKKSLTSTRGFASMDRETQLAIARKGGASVPNEKRSFSQNRRLAAEAGRKGGQSVNPINRSFSRNHALASEAGRKGGHASHPGPKKAGDQE
jgi:uncharacterized protein